MPQRVSDSMGDVLGVRRGEPTGSKESGGPPPSAFSENVFQICSVLEFLNSTWPGGVDLADGCYLLVGDHFETLESKTVTRNVRWVIPARSVPLSCPATGPSPGTPPSPRLKTTTGGLLRDGPGTPIEVNASPHLTPNPNSTPVT